MRVVVGRHPSALDHDTGRSHPERPERVEAVFEGIGESGLEVIDIESPEILRSELALVHDPSYIGMVEKFCELGGGALDMDTMVSPQTWEAALTAAGGVKAVAGALDGETTDGVGFVLTRPPGHHALRDRAMGFCVFNNIAITAALLRSEGHRVAIVDWDVHHGNGTQSFVINDPGILYASIHQSPYYPFEGEVADIDFGEAKGTTVNVPLPAGTAGDAYRRAWAEIVIPAVRQFAPDWILASAGYDGHVADPIADFRLIESDYGWIAAKLGEVHDPNRTVMVLEGGYDLDALRQSVSATLLGFSGIVPGEAPLQSPPDSFTAFEQAKGEIGRHWAL